MSFLQNFMEGVVWIVVGVCTLLLLVYVGRGRCGRQASKDMAAAEVRLGGGLVRGVDGDWLAGGAI